MKIIKDPTSGTLLADGDLTALRLGLPDSETLVYLSYALITQGPGHQILPSVLLDDWGKEIRHLELYRWIEDNGQRFPRAEVFGTDPGGAQVQYFLRDLELLARYPLYAFAEKDAMPSSAVPIRAILLPDDAVDEPQRAGPPGDLKFPLRRASIEWWRVNARQTDLGFLRRHAGSDVME